MPEPRPFRPRLFLFRMLAGLFVAEFALMFYSIWHCAAVARDMSEATPVDACPKVGQRAQELFTLSITTVLSLLTDTKEP